ncbi:hypothetical protein GUJ93_ZPchr0009g566 [Zizania palustris]|uniref:Uncharacterized protein n=1 Tax=Zizania palustris TaxID=103762 RepID=A0A8J5S381_ZIZPA|nr:hypothetical protein GUJ93_ZPchr0009g2307 [Zizania palustris]KAG8050059.1 hypothetical protein GUJ93_ZPchr0009g566 [Zizania palustris]
MQKLVATGLSGSVRPVRRGGFAGVASELNHGEEDTAEIDPLSHEDARDPEELAGATAELSRETESETTESLSLRMVMAMWSVDERTSWQSSRRAVEHKFCLRSRPRVDGTASESRQKILPMPIKATAMGPRSPACATAPRGILCCLLRCPAGQLLAISYRLGRTQQWQPEPAK